MRAIPEMESQIGLNKMKTLLRDFLEDRFSAGEFVDAFFPVARVLRDQVWDVVKADPTFKLAFDAYMEKRISPAEFEVQRAHFLASLGDVEIIPFSREEDALDHLWVEADAYRDDPQDRQPGLHIGDYELRQIVRETLTILEKSI